MRATDWVEFIVKLAPMLLDLGKSLFVRHGGDVDAATSELKKIREHGEKFRAFDQAAREELERLKKKS